MKRALVVHHTLDPPGGGSCVAAFALQALARSHRTTLLCWRPVDLAAVDRAFGTRLEAARHRFEVRRVPDRKRALLDRAPVPLALLTTHWLIRHARRLHAREPFDVVLSTINELAIGHPAVQYIHFPWAAYPRPDYDLRWYHWSPLLRGYRGVCGRLSGYRPEEARRNLTLVNSDWTGDRFAECYGVRGVTLPPPVPGDFPAVPWAEREDAVACVGRLSPEKELDKVVRIVAAVRERGHRLALRLIGHRDDAATVRRLERAARRCEWIRLESDLSRDELVRALARCRYGIHGMREEHFGIAVAELLRAGCIPFVPDGGGACEIVGGDARLAYGDEADAARKLARVAADPALQRTLHDLSLRRGERYSAARFEADLMRLVSDFEAEGGSRRRWTSPPAA